MKKDFTFTYGTETRTVQLEEDLLSAPFVAPRITEGESRDPFDVMKEALANPVDRPKLRDMVGGKTVALIVSDEFRAGLQRKILDVLIEEISVGKPKQLTVYCATGTHDPAIYAGKTEQWAKESSEKHNQPITFVGHNCDDPKLVHAGTTKRETKVLLEPGWLEADIRVCGHEAKHHYMAGYSSVAKAVLPGISGRVTVENNHKLALDDESKAGQHPMHSDPNRRTNPFSEDAFDAFNMSIQKRLVDGKLVDDQPGESFLLDMISDKDDIFFLQAGEPEKVTRAVLDAADEQAEFAVNKSRYVVVSPGGPPASTALYGVQNCFDMAILGAIEQGGEALVFGPCNGRPGVSDDVKGIAPDGKSKALFWDNLVRMKDMPLQDCYDEIDGDFKLYLWKTWRVLRMFKRDNIKLYIHGELPEEILKAGGFEAAPDPQAWIDERIARGDGKFVAIDGGNKLLVRGK